MKSSDGTFDDLVIQATTATDKKLFAKALVLWSHVRQANPSFPKGYTSAARVHCALGEFDEAERLCLLGMGKCKSPDLDLLVTHCDVASVQKDFPTALNRLSLVRKHFPHIDVGYRNAAFIHMELQNYDDADEICEEGIIKCKQTIRLFNVYIEILLNKNLNEKDRLFQLFSRRMNFCYTHPQLLDEIYLLANICGKLVKYDKSYCLIYNLLIQNIINNHRDNHESLGKTNDKFPQLCFFSITVQKLKYFIYVIRCFLPCTLDIVIENKYDNDEKYIREYCIDQFNIVYGKQYVKNYDYVICDGLLFHFNDYCGMHDNVISLPHGSDCSPRINTLKNSKLVIMNSKNQNGLDLTLDYSLFDSKTLSQYNKFNTNNRCEIAYTGPYHISKFPKNSYDNSIYKKNYFII